jgi:hypothetical protein
MKKIIIMTIFVISFISCTTNKKTIIIKQNSDKQNFNKAEKQRNEVYKTFEMEKELEKK